MMGYIYSSRAHGLGAWMRSRPSYPDAENVYSQNIHPYIPKTKDHNTIKKIYNYIDSASWGPSKVHAAIRGSLVDGEIFPIWSTFVSKEVVYYGKWFKKGSRLLFDFVKIYTAWTAMGSSEPLCDISAQIWAIHFLSAFQSGNPSRDT